MAAAGFGVEGVVKAETQLVGLPAEGVRWFRGATTRKNVRCEVRQFKTPGETAEDVLTALVEEKKAQYGGQGRWWYITTRSRRRSDTRSGGGCLC